LIDQSESRVDGKKDPVLYARVVCFASCAALAVALEFWAVWLVVVRAPDDYDTNL
jgi:hypothetical protein